MRGDSFSLFYIKRWMCSQRYTYVPFFMVIYEEVKGALNLF